MAGTRTTSLHDRHLSLGARMGDFAGWDMPLQYTSPRAEHMAVRTACGVFDVSHMGQIEVSGPEAREFLAWALTNDIREIGPGQGQYTLMLDDDGGVIDDLIVYALLDRFLLVVNAGNVAACRERLLDGAAGRDLTVSDRSDEVAMLALQGPAWAGVVAPLAGTPGPLNLEYFEVTEDQIAGVPALIARTGYTGEPGIEIMCPWDHAPRLWDALMAGGAVTPCGLVSRDTLRTEMGYPLYGQELARDRTPVEAGVLWACDTEGARFAGAETVLRQMRDGTEQKLCAFELTEPGIPRPGLTVLHEGAPVGTVTSGTLSPVLERGIGMAYVRADLARSGNDIVIDVRGRPRTARTAKRPLVARSPRND